MTIRIMIPPLLDQEGRRPNRRKYSAMSVAILIIVILVLFLIYR